MILKQTSLSNPIEEKIAWAQHCYQEFGDDLLKEKKLFDLLAHLKAAVVVSRREMALTGIIEICRRCDQEEGGSCCGAGLETGTMAGYSSSISSSALNSPKQGSRPTVVPLGKTDASLWPAM